MARDDIKAGPAGYAAIAVASADDASVIVGNLPADVRDDPFFGPVLSDGVLHVPEAVAEIARAAAADIEAARRAAWPVAAVHVAWLKAALAEAGKLAAVNAAVAKAGPVSAALWEYATTIRADDRDVIAVAATLDLDVPALFRAAEALRRARL